MPALTNASGMLRRVEAKPSGVVAVLERFPEAALRAFAALSSDEVVASLIGLYLNEWRHDRPELSGDDLLAMGVPEGPQIGRGLQLLRAARLDGWVSDRDDERALMLRFAKSIRDSRAMSQPIDFKFDGS
jgi:tRNA nucleotidyltransferase (CCA-adding enzyme)